MKQEKKRREDVIYRFVSMSSFGFLSHMPIVTAACTVTTGPIIELGSGFGSTFALHGMCAKDKRQVLTLESDEVWLGSFWVYGRTWHRIKHTPSFIDLPDYTDQEWGLAIVDHGILGERGIALKGLSHVPVIVAHDTDFEALNYTNDGVPQILDSFKYRYNFKFTMPQTSVLSNTIDVEDLFGGLQL